MLRVSCWIAVLTTVACVSWSCLVSPGLSAPGVNRTFAALLAIAVLTHLHTLICTMQCMHMASGLLSILLGLLATQAPAVFPAVLPLLLCLALSLTHILPNVIFEQSLGYERKKV